jgi:predicted DCC family thiol-disulfide oxidoreductase YuxK
MMSVGAEKDVDVLLYDGVCALCNGTVRFLVDRDRDRRFRYAALQSDFARAALAQYGEDTTELSTVFLLQHYGRPEQSCLRRSRAVLAATKKLGGGWGFLARVLSLLPTFLLDAGYRMVARSRYRTFGRYDACPVPPPEHRDLFLDGAARSIP